MSKNKLDPHYYLATDEGRVRVEHWGLVLIHFLLLPKKTEVTLSQKACEPNFLLQSELEGLKIMSENAQKKKKNHIFWKTETLRLRESVT